ncbi:MAG: general secretion pathway protein GspK [Pseudomonadota bacterium]
MRSERGFVLAITLWLLAGMAVVVGLMTWWALGEVRAASAERHAVEDDAALVSVRETVIYVAATREFTRAGLPVEPMDDARRAVLRLDELGTLNKEPRGGELRMDGRAYRAPGDVRFALQDESGLFSLIVPPPAALDRFLHTQGVPSGDIPRLRDALLDYMDVDDLRRLAGVETEDARRVGRAPPAQRRLLAPAELASVPGWDALPVDAIDRIATHVTTTYGGAVNLNTMPASLLPAWIAGCPEACERVAQQRDIRPFTDGRDLQLRSTVGLPGDAALDYRFLASDAFRITLWGRSGGGWRIHVRLTPLADKTGPWSLLAAYPVTRPPDAAPASLPESALFADPATRGHIRDHAAAGRSAGPDRLGGSARAAALPAL